MLFKTPGISGLSFLSLHTYTEKLDRIANPLGLKGIHLQKCYGFSTVAKFLLNQTAGASTVVSTGVLASLPAIVPAPLCLQEPYRLFLRGSIREA